MYAVTLIEADADASGALKLMSTNNVGRLIVMDDGQMAGIFFLTSDRYV
jgi:predicted transcriptional regulator